MKVKNLAELHVLQKSGAVKNVEGMRFVEPAKQEAPQAAPAPQVSLEPLVAAIQESMAKQTALSRENMLAMYELVKSLARTPQALPVAAPAPRPTRWEFTVVRDEDGFVAKILANAVE